MLICIAIFTCLPSCINLSKIMTIILDSVCANGAVDREVPGQEESSTVTITTYRKCRR